MLLIEVNPTFEGAHLRRIRQTDDKLDEIFTIVPSESGVQK